MEAIENRPQADVDWEADSMALMQLKESPVASPGWDTKTLVDDEPDADPVALIKLEEQAIVPVLYCPFCKWSDEEAGPQKRDYIFSRPDSLERHLRVQHLNNRAADEGFDCPYEGCSAFLGGAIHFLNHRECQHSRHQIT